MKRIVFYSWQSDLPNSTNRGFIQQALEGAAAAIANDSTIEVEPVVDRDTQGVAGSPDIASTIFTKITAADVFVADVSIISQPKKGRPTPNPNVLIELGYALKSLGHERVILVFNKSFGKIEQLPFDLRMRRLMVYEMPDGASDKAAERQKLEKQLESAIRAASAHVPVKEEPANPTITAIENGAPNKIIVLRRGLADLFRKISDKKPRMFRDGGTVDELVTAIDSTQEPVAEFSKIVETTAVMKDLECAKEICKWFGSVFEEYYPRRTNGRVSDADGDYFKFVGHEMFVTMVAFYLREERWDILRKILRELIPLKYHEPANGPYTADWHFASDHLSLLLSESPKRQRISLHSDILQARHTTGGLSVIMPFDEFASADFYLFLLSELPPTEYGDGKWDWRPWSVLFMKNAPLFLRHAVEKGYAQNLSDSLNVPSIDEFKKRLKERHAEVHKLFRQGFWHTNINQRDIDAVATR